MRSDIEKKSLAINEEFLEAFQAVKEVLCATLSKIVSLFKINLIIRQVSVVHNNFMIMLKLKKSEV